MGYTKAELENKYGVTAYIHWYRVPIYLHARNWFKKNHKVVIPEDAEPDGVKGGCNKPKYYLLFDERKYLPVERQTKPESQDQERPRLKVNFER